MCAACTVLSQGSVPCLPSHQTLLLLVCTLRRACMAAAIWPSQPPRAGAKPCKPWLCAFASTHVILVAGHNQTPWPAQLLILRSGPTPYAPPLALSNVWTLHQLLQPSWGSYPGSAAHPGLCQNRALRRHKRMRRHPPMQRPASGMQRRPQATEGFRGTLNPTLLCLPTSGPRRDMRPTRRPPMRQSAWRSRKRCWARVDKPASLFHTLHPTPNALSLRVHARSHDKNPHKPNFERSSQWPP